MGVGETEVPKKKLKQAQLNFCVTPPGAKSSNKRKFNSDSPRDVGLALKVFRKDTPDTPSELEKGGQKVHGDGPKGVANRPSPESEMEVVVLEDSADCVRVGSTAKTHKIESSAVGLELFCSEKENSTDGKGVDKKESAAAGALHQPHGEGTTTEVKLGHTENQEQGDDLHESNPLDGDGERDSSRNISSEKESSLVVNKPSEVDDENSALEKKVKECNEQTNQQPPPDVACIDKKPITAPGGVEETNKPFESVEGGPDVSITLSSEDERNPHTPPLKKRRTTPKSSAKKAERQKLQEEKLRLKKERDEQKRQEREEKERKRTEELRLKEEDRKRKEDEKKKKEHAKEEERKRKEEEKKKKEEAKDEERKKKEEEKRKKEELKEEDRRKKEEARLAEERKENLAKQAFTKFFIANKTRTNPTKKDCGDNSSDDAEVPKFMPFPIKADMRLAVQVRRTLTDDDKNTLSCLLDSGVPKEKLYVGELKVGIRKYKSMPATWPLSEEQHDVIIVESVVEGRRDADVKTTASRCKRQRAKLLQFHENRRPPYWGTWRKCSRSVTPRRPFGKEAVLDYEVDSDSEWEDEEEGEDIDKEGESDKEQSDDEEVGENGYMLDNTFVPHGYLSDEEAAEEESFNPEDQKVKLKVLKQEFEQEMKSKAERLKPRLLGCVWISNDTAEVSKGSLYETLMNFRCKWDEAGGPINVTCQSVVDYVPSANPKFPSTMVEHLAKLVHGSHSSFKALISEFLNTFDREKYLSSISKRAVYLKIKEISQKTHSGGRSVWVVNPEICTDYNLPPIVEPKSTPSTPTTPAAEVTKPKESPLVSFLKKNSTPRKRIATTLIPPVAAEDKADTKPPDSTSATKLPVSAFAKPATNMSDSAMVKPDSKPPDSTSNKLDSMPFDSTSTQPDSKPPDSNLVNSPQQAPTPPVVKKRIATTFVGPLKSGTTHKPPASPSVASAKLPAASTTTPVRKRVPLITLSKTAGLKIPTASPPNNNNKLSNFFSPKPQCVSAKKPAAPAELIDLCEDSK